MQHNGTTVPRMEWRNNIFSLAHDRILKLLFLPFLMDFADLPKIQTHLTSCFKKTKMQTWTASLSLPVSLVEPFCSTIKTPHWQTLHSFLPRWTENTKVVHVVAGNDQMTGGSWERSNGRKKRAEKVILSPNCYVQTTAGYQKTADVSVKRNRKKY